MSIYFHLASHLWIFYLFIANGFLIHGFLRYTSSRRTSNYLNMTDSLEASLLASFFISLSLNSCLLLVLDIFDQSFALMKGLLPAISFCFLILVYKSGISNFLLHLKFEFGWSRCLLYAFVFFILFYNGGLIEQTSDAWWHMSLANKIGVASSFSLEVGHLTGDPTRYYPPLWHANLALANVVSSEAIPVFWNSFTAWGGALKVMSFYLLAVALSANRSISFLSALLFVLLPGMGDSYLRVSAWPSHIAYTAMFCLFYVTFWLITNYQRHEVSASRSIYQYVFSQRASIGAFICLSAIIWFVHQLEILWFFMGMLIYFSSLVLYGISKGTKLPIEATGNKFLVLITVISILIAFGAAVFGLVSNWNQIVLNVDWMLVSLTVIVFLFSLLLMCYCAQSNKFSLLRNFLLVCISITALVIVLSIDIKHVFSLAFRSAAYPAPESHEWPHIVFGYFGGKLELPSWDLQLRAALLYSGILSIPLSIIALITTPSRLTLFVCSNALIAFLFCVSPYLYFWLSEVLDYHSTWRVAILILHPIIISYALHTMWVSSFRTQKI